MPDILERPKLDEPGTGSPDDCSHYCRRSEISRAAVEGGKVQALCGIMFEPVRDPERFPPCADCVRIREQLRDE